MDRPALKEQLKCPVDGRGLPQSNGCPWRLGALIAGPLVDVGVDTLVRPDVFRAVAVEHGYAPDKPIPGVIAIGQFVRPLDGGPRLRHHQEATDRACWCSRTRTGLEADRVSRAALTSARAAS